jgi:hypothetical protein
VNTKSRIKIAHESPISIFDKVQQLTDYDYFLVHLFEEHPEYLSKYEKSKLKRRTTYLDNSIFELGTAFESSKFANWITRLSPDYYFIPDVLESSKGTIRSAIKWMDEYRDKLPGTPVGVVQGKTLEELIDCYTFMDTLLDVQMIAISFDYSFYQTYFPHPNKYVSWAMGRVKLLNEMHRSGVINSNKKHHLLGLSLPMEGWFYKDIDWITSIDTSNPVVHGIKGIQYYPGQGLMNKESQKLFEMINMPLEDTNFNVVQENIHEFRRIWS